MKWKRKRSTLKYSESSDFIQENFNPIQEVKLFKLIINQQKSPAASPESQFVLTIVKQFVSMTARPTPVIMCRHFEPHSARLDNTEKGLVAWE